MSSWPYGTWEFLANWTDSTWGNTFDPSTLSASELQAFRQGAVDIVKGITGATFNGYESWLATLQRYPPTSLTADTTTISGESYGNGTYITSADSYYSGWQYGAPWNSFDYFYTWDKNWLHSLSSTSGWIQIQMPSHIVLKEFSLWFNGPEGVALDFNVEGSNDGGTTMTQLYTVTDKAYETPTSFPDDMRTDYPSPATQQPLANLKTTTVDLSANTTAYSTYRLNITRHSTNHYTHLLQWVMMGTPE